MPFDAQMPIDQAAFCSFSDSSNLACGLSKQKSNDDGFLFNNRVIKRIQQYNTKYGNTILK